MNYHPSSFALHYWQTWLVGWFVSFITFEMYQITNGHPENTLSAAVWHWLGVVKGQPISQWSFLHFIVIGLMALTFGWLIGHFGWMDWT